MVLLALYALQCWLDGARWRDAVFFGVTAGVAVGAKFSAIPFLVLGFVVLAGALWVVRRRVAGGAGERGAVGRGVAAAERGGRRSRPSRRGGSMYQWHARGSSGWCLLS